ncbi:MAG: VCBS repeat-containing protein, partial [Planctomycetes bacterium]|nr:VCBS repeat-containing protein [Planctomycetota bacterium]
MVESRYGSGSTRSRCRPRGSAAPLLVVALAAAPADVAAGADCDLDGKDDAGEIAAGTAEDCNGNLVPDACELVPVELGIGAVLELKGQARGIDVADLDGNGRADLLSLSAAQSRFWIGVHRRGPGGEWTRADHEADSFGGSGLEALDLDGDGELDVVLAGLNGVAVRFGAGGGGLDGLVAVPEAGGATDLAGGDIDGDGAEDLVGILASTDEATVVFGSASRVLTRVARHPVGDSPRSLSVVDLDGDGDLDVLTGNFTSGDLSVLRNLEGGGLGLAETVPVGISRLAAVAAGDLDGDGRADLAAAGWKALAVSLGDGAGGLGPAASLPFAAISLSAGDLDGDRLSDLAAGVTASPVVVLLRDAAGPKPTAAQRLGLGGAAAGPAKFIAAGDLNGDGAVDLAAAAYGGSSASLFLSGGDAVEGASVSLEPRGILRLSSAEPHGAALGDLDSDGDPDVVTANGGWGTLSVCLNDGGGALEVKSTLHVAGYLVPVVIEDLDSDGDEDVVASGIRGDGGVQVLVNGGAAALAKAGLYAVGEVSQLAAGDLDGDGLPEIVAGSYSNALTVLVNEGGARFRSERRGLGRTSETVALADLDADGDLDLAVGSTTGGRVSAALNDGKGAFGEPAGQGAFAPVDLASGDFDGDADPDLAAAGYDGAQGALTLLESDGRGGLAASPSFRAGSAPLAVTACDLAGDGHPDLAVADTGQGRILVFLLRGGVVVGSAAAGVSSGPREVLAGDMDSDGDPDLVSADHDASSLTVFINGAAATASRKGYLEALCTEGDFHLVSARAGGGGEVVRVTKYLAPARAGDPSLLPVLFQDVRRYPLHQDFLAGAFPERFPALTPETYDALTARRATRRYFVGDLYLLETAEGPLYGFNILAGYLDDPAEAPALAEARFVYDLLSRASTLRPFAYHPDLLPARREAEKWRDPGFPVYLGPPPRELVYRAYTRGVAYGRVRVLSLEGLEEASRTGRVSFQDVLVLERAPRDIEGVP